MLEETLEALKMDEPKPAGPGAARESPAIAELDRQAIELEKKACQLIQAIEALKLKAGPRANSPPLGGR